MLNVRWSQLIFWTYLHDDNDRPVYLQPEGKILLGERIHIREDHDDKDDIWMKVLQDLYSRQHVQTLQLLKEPYFHISGILKGTQSIKPFPYPREPNLFCQFFVSSPGHLLPTIWSSANQVKTKVQEANAKLDFKLELPSPSPLWLFFTPSQTIFTPNQTNFWKKIFQANAKLAFMLRWSEGNVESGRRPANDILLLEYFDQISNGFNFQVTYQIYQEHLLVRQLCQEPRWALESWRRTRCSRGTYSQFVEDFGDLCFFCSFLRLNIASNISASAIQFYPSPVSSSVHIIKGWCTS